MHARGNQVKEVGLCRRGGESLKIVDLGVNLIEEEGQLLSLVGFEGLEIINLEGNPLVVDSEWKQNWRGSFSIDLIFEMDNLYVMSDFGHQKDIAFGKSKPIPTNS